MGTISFEVPGPGTYQVQCDPKLDPLANAGTAGDVLAGKQFYNDQNQVVTGTLVPASPTYAGVLVVTVDAGAEVTATDGTTTLTATSTGTATFNLPNGGTWTVSATLNGSEATSATVEVQENFSLALSAGATQIVNVPTQYKAQVSFSYEPMEFTYTGESVPIILGVGRYKLECWGAEGGYRSASSYAGKGGYSVGTLTLTETTNLFVRVGGSGATGGTDGGFNGGGKRSSYPGGGGASDIRIGADDVNHRVIVAGGGGSDGGAAKPGRYGGGRSGGDVGVSGSANGYGTAGYGGTQTGNSGGASWIAEAQSATTTNDADAKSGFGFGGNGINKNSGFGGAGGGGWYGGTGRIPDSSADDDGGGGGGSGFVWIGENAPEGFGLTGAHYLKDAETIDGSKAFTSPSGENETGHTGDGYVRITPIPPLKMYTITVVAGENGTAAGGGVYEEGTQVTVTAAPNDGYKLASWMENGESVSTSKKYTFTADRNRTLTAVFMEGVDSRLPEGYTEVEYIESTDGNQKSINTAQQYSEKSKCVLKFSFSENAPNNRFLIYSHGYTTVGGNRYNTTLNTYTSNGKIHGYIVQGGTTRFSSDISTEIPSIPATLDLDLPNKTITLLGDSFDISVLSSNSLKPIIFIFGNYAGTNGSTPIGRFYSYKYYEDGTLIQDMVPCINPNNIVGLYDIVNNEFFTTSTTYNYTAGPAV